MPVSSTPLQFVLKIASRCNLNCSYCYVYHRGDDSWKARPTMMSDDVLDAALMRMRATVDASGQDSVTVTLHGGEPLAVGRARFGEICRRIRQALGHVRLLIAVQTNGTLLDPQWVALFAEHEVDVGISIDGPKEVHDANRVDHEGRGSYEAVASAARFMKEGGRNLNFLTVIPFGADPVALHRHLVSFQPSGISYLLPDYTYETIGPCARGTDRLRAQIS